MNIRNVKIKGIAALAPMAGITDRAFREICATFGASYFTSEMISVKGLIYKSQKTFDLIDRSKTDEPFAVQLFGSNPSDFAEAIKLLSNQMPDVIDINMGCPATKIVKENSGSALMKNPDLCREIVKSAKSASPVPVTVKVRAGWDHKSINAAKIAKICEEAGADAITIHGRTREQGYSGFSDLNIIKEVKKSVKIPVIGNGDIISAESAQKMIEFTECDMVTIGRGAMGNPWIFSEINSRLCDKKIWVPSTLHEKIIVMKKHIEKLCEYKGEERGVKEARKHISSYVKDVPGAALFRKSAFLAKNKSELLNLCDQICEATLNK